MSVYHTNMYNFISLLHFLVAAFNINFSLQNCPKEVSTKGIPVTWHESKPDTSSVSEPLCYHKERLITRYCNSSGWSPSLLDLQPCFKVEVFDLRVSSCPPGYEEVTKSNNRYCYQIGEPSTWNYPCLKNGGASIVTDLTQEEFDSLLQSLRKLNNSEYFWLPAQRRKAFGPVVWNIPGPNWGQVLDSAELMQFSSLIRKCLVLDSNKGIITTESCNKQFPSLCIYLEDMEYPAKCPSGYYGLRFISDNGTCFGIEYTEDPNGSTFDNFPNSQCKNPLGNSMYRDLTKFIFMKIAEMDNLPDNTWCFFETPNNIIFDNNYNDSLKVPNALVVINKNSTVGLINRSAALTCMACETQIIYSGDTVLDLEFNAEDFKLYLTIYYPLGLWKYDNDDIGVQCFSDALGFFTTVNVEFIPIIETDARMYMENTNSTFVEKSIYSVHPITNRSAQYWCEAHNKSYSLLSSSKVIVNPTSNQLHVFSLVTKINLYDNETVPQLDTITAKLTEYLKAEKVIIMDILEYHVNYLLVLLHIHASISEDFEDEPNNLEATYESLKSDIISFLTQQDYTFVNFSSSQYCFPATSFDYIVLEWELTAIGQIAAPKQFCLQNNGLPVKRNCIGSYLTGGRWGEVEGNCNKDYEPSSTTTFLYNFAKGNISENCTSRFLTDGLEFVLDDVNIIIPADIYYLSMSFQTILDIAENNDSSIDLGDVENMAWAMDRILLMDMDYLRLSQTFNSTNVILDSVSGIFEKLAKRTIASQILPTKAYQLSIKPQFIVQISYPTYNNITGIAVSKRSDSDDFNDMIIQRLYANTTIDSVVSIENLEVAAWIPSTVLKTIQKLSNDSDDKFISKRDVHIVINVYNNDAIFPELDESKHLINSRIVSLTIPGYKTNLVNSIPLLFKELRKVNSKQACGFWNYQTKKEGSNPGFWSNHGCFYEKSLNDITICRCYHMTHFGQLLNIGELKKPNEKNHMKCHIKALNIITLVGSFLSLFGITGLWITAMVFQTWRKKPSTKILLQLSTAIALPLIFMIVFNLDNSIFYEKDGNYIVRESKKIVCIVLGSLLQYSILASFMWMLITAILQFIRYVRVLGVCRPSRFMVKFTLIGWGVPIIPVAVILVINSETYIPDPTLSSDKSICYPDGIYLVMGIILPIGIVLIVNVVLFLSVLISISHGPEGKIKTPDIDLIKTQLRLSLFLFFLLGLTWIFGLFSFSNNLLWSYLFCLTSTLQGFVLFIYFVICDPVTRNLWATLMKPQFLTLSRKSISSISSS